MLRSNRGLGIPPVALIIALKSYVKRASMRVGYIWSNFFTMEQLQQDGKEKFQLYINMIALFVLVPKMANFLITKFLDDLSNKGVKIGLLGTNGRWTTLSKRWSETVKSTTKCTIQEILSF